MAARDTVRYLIGLAFIAAGANHFASSDFYERMMPDSLPAHEELVALSGVAESGLGALALSDNTKRLAGWGLLALLVAVFPANLKMALHPEEFPEIPEPLLWLRLPIQPLMMAVVYWALLKEK